MSVLVNVGLVGATALWFRSQGLRIARNFEHEANLLALDKLVASNRLDVIADRCCHHAKMSVLRVPPSSAHAPHQEELQVMINYLREKKNMDLNVDVQAHPDKNSLITITVSIDGQVIDTDRTKKTD